VQSKPKFANNKNAHPHTKYDTSTKLDIKDHTIIPANDYKVNENTQHHKIFIAKA